MRGADAVVEVIAHDLSSPYQFLRAAEVLAAADRIDDALDWLSRGRAAFGDADERLADMAADLHHRAGRHGQAADIARQRFTADPSLGAYQRLHEFAAAAGDWPERREAALELLRAQPIAGAARPGPSWTQPPGHSILVEVLMWEGDMTPPGTLPSTADAPAGAGLKWPAPARDSTLLTPSPSLSRRSCDAIEGVKRSAYRAAAELAKELRGYAERADQTVEFAAWVRKVRTDNTRRRALQNEFDLARLPR